MSKLEKPIKETEELNAMILEWDAAAVRGFEEGETQVKTVITYIRVSMDRS